MCTRMLTIIGLILVTTVGNAWADEFEKLPDTSILPPGTVKSSGIVPMMGEHWVNPKDHPLGPIYCVHKGKVVCIEYMMSQADLQAGKSWPELVGLKNLPPINHVDMGFVAKGHPGYEIPHYDLHIYFVSRDALKTIVPTQ
jgi:hypothetical protein